ncbi:MAG: hypothetical protein HZB13_03815 [Acidobacteria bacterium]|nr:hypothetical protein [Acidobacteriota bacterium]
MIGDKAPYKEAVNIVRMAYEREGEAVRSAAVLAEDAAVAARIEAVSKSFVEAGLKADLERLAAYARAAGVDPVQGAALSPEEIAAARIVPVKKRSIAGMGGGGGARGARGAPTDPVEASRAQYLAMEYRGFADGKRSVLDIRNAVSAEYGAQDTAKVLEFFRAGEKSGEFELVQRGQ